MTFDFISCQKSKVLSSTVEGQKPTTRMASLPHGGEWRGAVGAWPAFYLSLPLGGVGGGPGGAGEGLL